MSHWFWVRRRQTSQEVLATGLMALATAAAAGAVTWYLTRTLLSRDPISLRPEDGSRIGGTAVKALPSSSGVEATAGDALE